jgi:hypothetical protein
LRVELDANGHFLKVAMPTFCAFKKQLLKKAPNSAYTTLKTECDHA